MQKKLIPVVALLVGSLGCADDSTLPSAVVTNPPAATRPYGFMSATAEATEWHTVFITASRTDAFLVLQGEMFLVDGESTIAIRLTIRTDSGADPQAIGPSTAIAADVIYRPAYDASQGWSASGPNGSGTITLTSLTSDRATGTFSFTANALTDTAEPPTFRVTNGLFDVRFK